MNVDHQLERLDELIIPLVSARAPGLLAPYGIGPHTAALRLIAAEDHPGRLRSEAAWAHLCAAAPIPASSGKATRHRLNSGGDRQANQALWRIAFTRRAEPVVRPEARSGRRVSPEAADGSLVISTSRVDGRLGLAVSARRARLLTPYRHATRSACT